MQLRVLAVDDDPEVLEVFATVVKSAGWEVVGLTDSRAAAQRVMREKFDLVALDIRMPHLDGFELAERVRASHSNRDVPILMFTGFDDVETMRRAFAAGVTFYMPKPLNVTKLRGLLKAARGSMLQERRRYIRLPLRQEVICRAGGKQLRIRSVNIAQGGILLEALGGLAKGDIAEIEFALPSVSESLKLMVKVVWTASEGVALEFIDPEPSDREALLKYVTLLTKE
ncbi:MAG: response regulator [Terriglobia bacterium]